MMVVSISEIKEHLKIQFDEEDALIERLSRQAQAAAEDYCRTTFDESAPEPVKLAILLMIGHYYENRENSDKQAFLAMRMAFTSLLYPHRDPDMFF